MRPGTMHHEGSRVWLYIDPVPSEMYGFDDTGFEIVEEVGSWGPTSS